MAEHLHHLLVRAKTKLHTIIHGKPDTITSFRVLGWQKAPTPHSARQNTSQPHPTPSTTTREPGEPVISSPIAGTFKHDIHIPQDHDSALPLLRQRSILKYTSQAHQSELVDRQLLEALQASQQETQVIQDKLHDAERKTATLSHRLAGVNHQNAAQGQVIHGLETEADGLDQPIRELEAERMADREVLKAVRGRMWIPQWCFKAKIAELALRLALAEDEVRERDEVIGEVKKDLREAREELWARMHGSETESE